MSVHLRLNRSLLQQIHVDLSRRHPYALERVCFMTCRPAGLRRPGIVLIGDGFYPVADEDYEQDDTVGAMLGAGAFRRILELAYSQAFSVLHVHRHEHLGTPSFSYVDLREASRYVPDFWKVRPGYPHGVLVLSHDSAAGLIWLPQSKVQSRLSRISIVGVPLQEVCDD